MRKILFLLVFSGACGAGKSATTTPALPTLANDEKADSQTGSAPPSAAHDCIVDTIAYNDPVEFAQDLDKSIDATFIIQFGGTYIPQVRIPAAFQGWIEPNADFGGFLYTFHGWNIVPRDLVGDAGFVPAQLPANTDPNDQVFAVLSASPVHGTYQKFAKKKYTVAQAIFEALTRATETKTDHIVTQPAYDQSWRRVRRSTPNGRLICDSITFPDSKESEPSFTCMISKVIWNEVQEFDASSGDGFCPSP